MIKAVKVSSQVKGDLLYKELKKKFADIERRYVAVGIINPGSAYPDSPDVTVGEVAMWQEFGTQKTPSRSFLRTPFDKGVAQVLRLKAKLAAQIIVDKITVNQALAVLGQDCVRRIQSTIKRRINPPLAPLTLENRAARGNKSTVPLIDTGKLYKSIGFAVRYNQKA